MMKRLLGAHVESSHTELRYKGGIIAQMRAAQMQNRKTISVLLVDVVDVSPTPEETSLNAKPYSSTRPTPR
jgi:hypothetical protein